MQTQLREFLSDSEVANRYGVTRQTIWRWATLGRLAPPIKLGENCTRWRRSDVEAFEAECLNKARDKIKGSMSE